MEQKYYPSGPFLRRLSDDSEFEALREDFLLDYASEATARAYKADLEDFREWCTTNAIDPITASREQIVAYVHSLQTRGYSPHTTSRRLSALRGFFRHLVLRGWLRHSPVEGLQGVRLRLGTKERC
jgi:integrase/recombinase XerD